MIHILYTHLSESGADGYTVPPRVLHNVICIHILIRIQREREYCAIYVQCVIMCYTLRYYYANRMTYYRTCASQSPNGPLLFVSYIPVTFDLVTVSL